VQMGQAEQVGNNNVMNWMWGRKDQGEAIVGTTIDILEKVETCWMAGNTQRPESDTKSKIGLLYRG
jgi:hypothetical protein